MNAENSTEPTRGCDLAVGSSAWLASSDNPRVKAQIHVHFMGFGMTACLVNGPPSSWPENHRWSSDWADVNCRACLAGRELIHTFTIADDGKSITCLRCKRTSHNAHDVEHHYCGYCHVFHDDLWPPARKAWLSMANDPSSATRPKDD